MIVPHDQMTFPCLPLGGWLKPRPFHHVLPRQKWGQGGPPHPTFSQQVDLSRGTLHRNRSFPGSVLSYLQDPTQDTVSTTSTRWDVARESHWALWSHPKGGLASFSNCACFFFAVVAPASTSTRDRCHWPQWQQYRRAVLPGIQMAITHQLSLCQSVASVSLP